MAKKTTVIKTIRTLYYFLIIPLMLLIQQLAAYATYMRQRTVVMWPWTLLVLLAYILVGTVIGMIGLLSRIEQKGKWKIDWMRLIAAAAGIVFIICLWIPSSFLDSLYHLLRGLYQPFFTTSLSILSGYLIISSFRKKQVCEEVVVTNVETKMPEEKGC